MDGRILNTVNEKGNIIGKATREEIHEKGLLHMEIHVWFFTPDGKLIFQHRAKDKDTFPDALDATVGGHVEVNESYEDAAIKEVYEETGQTINVNDLTFITTTITNYFDKGTGMTNNAIRNVYAYRFDGRVSDLKVEENKAQGFEAIKVDDLFNLSKELQTRMIPGRIDEIGMSVIKKIKALI